MRISTVAKCWECGNESSLLELTFKHGQKCGCGGYVITPSGRIQGRYTGVRESVAR